VGRKKVTIDTTSPIIGPVLSVELSFEEDSGGVDAIVEVFVEPEVFENR
jgi:hypothetical protein